LKEFSPPSWSKQTGLEPVFVPSVEPGAKAPPLTQSQAPFIARQIEVVSGRFPEGSHVRVFPTSDGFRVQLTFPMFESGSSKLTQQGARHADLGATILAPYQARVLSIEIVGHTAAEEAEREEGSALRLSLSRSREGLRHLTRAEARPRLDLVRMTAGGRGPYDPVADNADEKKRPLNRRIDFVVRLHPNPAP
jgi:flagellar motor protein MotB